MKRKDKKADSKLEEAPFITWCTKNMESRHAKVEINITFQNFLARVREPQGNGEAGT